MFSHLSLYQNLTFIAIVLFAISLLVDMSKSDRGVKSESPLRDAYRKKAVIASITVAAVGIAYAVAFTVVLYGLSAYVISPDGGRLLAMMYELIATLAGIAIGLGAIKLALDFYTGTGGGGTRKPFFGGSRRLVGVKVVFEKPGHRRTMQFAMAM